MTRTPAIRIVQLIIACLALVLPIKIALTLDRSNFRDLLHPAWWGAYLVVTVACFVAMHWTDIGFPKLLFVAGTFAALNGLLFLFSPVPSKSIYWEVWQILTPGDEDGSNRSPTSRDMTTPTSRSSEMLSTNYNHHTVIDARSRW